MEYFSGKWLTLRKNRLFFLFENYMFVHSCYSLKEVIITASLSTLLTKEILPVLTALSSKNG